MRKVGFALICFLVFCCSLYPVSAFAQIEQGGISHDDLVAAARAIMAEARYCSLITLDASGSPDVRTMDPFAPEEDMVVWLGSRRGSRKIEQIRNDSRVALHYFIATGSGYVTIRGRARIVDDAEARALYWKEEWVPFYADREADYILIEVRPESLEILDYSKGIAGDPVTLKVPSVLFDANR